MADLRAYTAQDGSLWVLPEGPNHAPVYVGCTDADDITEPRGDIELIRCFGPDSNYQVVGSKTSPPDAVTTTLTSLTYRVRSVLEKIRCEYGLMFLQRDGGRADLFCNHQRALILTNVRNTERTYSGIVKRETPDESTRGFAISAYPPVIDVVEVEGNRKTTTEVNDFTDVYMLKDPCALLPVMEGVAVADASAFYGTGTVWLTHDGGQTWTKTATDPDIDDLGSCLLLDMCHGVRRILVASLGNGTAAQGYTQYSDDGGVTWLAVSPGTPVGGATSGLGVSHGGGLFAIDSQHVWLASVLGYIFFSSDGGESWTAQESHVITHEDYTQIEFTPDALTGYCVAGNGIVAKTLNGGTTWTACPTTSMGVTDHLLTVSVLDEDYVWVGNDNGEIWWTEDGGTTWTQRTGWTGSGIATTDVQDMAFVNDYVGFMIANLNGIGKVYRTIDGGYSWEVITATTAAALNAIAGGDANYAVYVGDVVGSYGFIGVVEE